MYRLAKEDIKSIINQHKSCFSSFVKSEDPNKLISHLKIDGSAPKRARNDKSYIYLNTGVMGEQGLQSTHIIPYLYEYFKIELKNIKYADVLPEQAIRHELKTKKVLEPKPSVAISNFIDSIYYMQNVPDNVTGEYFCAQRGIDIPPIDEFLDRIKYQPVASNRNVHSIFIPFDKDGGYQKIVLDDNLQKQKSQTRIYRMGTNREYKTTVMGDSKSEHTILCEGIEDALALMSCVKVREMKHEILDELFRLNDMDLIDFLPENTRIICCFGNNNLKKIAKNLPDAIIVADNDTFVTNEKKDLPNITVTLPYSLEGQLCKDFNNFLIIKRYL